MKSGHSGIDTSFMNKQVRPQDDLYRHFAGTWLDTYEIPADRAGDGVTRTLYDVAEIQVREIIETATGAGEAQKIGDLYKSFMDTDAIKAVSYTHLTLPTKRIV